MANNHLYRQLRRAEAEGNLDAYARQQFGVPDWQLLDQLTRLGVTLGQPDGKGKIGSKGLQTLQAAYPTVPVERLQALAQHIDSLPSGQQRQDAFALSLTGRFHGLTDGAPNLHAGDGNTKQVRNILDSMTTTLASDELVKRRGGADEEGAPKYRPSEPGSVRAALEGVFHAEREAGKALLESGNDQVLRSRTADILERSSARLADPDQDLRSHVEAAVEQSAASSFAETELGVPAP